MQGQIVKNCVNIVLIYQVANQGRPFFQGRQKEVKHIAIVGSVWRIKGEGKMPFSRQGLQALLISLPYRLSASLYIFHLLQLRKEKSRDRLRRQKRRADIHPTVFVHLPPVKSGPVGPFFP